MKLITGPRPPTHRKFNEQASIGYICNRYRNLHKVIAKQVEVLQHEKAFLDKCKDYYKNGYTDWVILNAIFNCMMNWKAKEQGLDIIRDEDKMQFSKLENSIQNTVYPTILFLGQELDEQIKIHNFISLKTYGFELRQKVITPEIVECIEKFLRYRMKHFDLDLPHSLLFGEPPGDWPET